ncbi:trypsin-like serine protease [Streptomyces lydicus]
MIPQSEIAAASAASLCLAFAGTAPDSVIVGGSDATLPTAPYHVAILERVWMGKSHVCVGFRLSANKVFTTAHCADGLVLQPQLREWVVAAIGHMPSRRLVRGTARSAVLLRCLRRLARPDGGRYRPDDAVNKDLGERVEPDK